MQKIRGSGVTVKASAQPQARCVGRETTSRLHIQLHIQLHISPRSRPNAAVGTRQRSTLND